MRRTVSYGQMRQILTSLNDEIREWRGEGTAHDPKCTTSSGKHGGGSVELWAWRTGCLVFADDVTADKSKRMNSEL